MVAVRLLRAAVAACSSCLFVEPDQFSSSFLWTDFVSRSSAYFESVCMFTAVVSSIALHASSIAAISLALLVLYLVEV
jgi:hypothetical protein